MRTAACFFTILIAIAVTAIGQFTLYVPDNYPTIQTAINAAQPWNSVHVVRGTYAENLVIRRSIVISAEAGVILVAFDKSLPAIAVSMDASNVLIRNFAIQGGSYGVVVSGNAKAHMYECSFSDNLTGVGVWDTATAILSTCEIQENQIGVLIAGSATLTARDCHIADNFSGIDAFIRDCGYGENGYEQFNGTVRGNGSFVAGNTITDLCPRYPGPPWPDELVDKRVGVGDEKERADLLVDAAIGLAN